MWSSSPRRLIAVVFVLVLVMGVSFLLKGDLFQFIGFTTDPSVQWRRVRILPIVVDTSQERHGGPGTHTSEDVVSAPGRRAPTLFLQLSHLIERSDREKTSLRQTIQSFLSSEKQFPFSLSCFDADADPIWQTQGYLLERVWPLKESIVVGGSFVEVGAGDGRTRPVTDLLECFFGWRGVCMEPHPVRFESLRLHRPSCRVEPTTLAHRTGQESSNVAIQKYHVQSVAWLDAFRQNDVPTPPWVAPRLHNGSHMTSEFVFPHPSPYLYSITWDDEMEGVLQHMPEVDSNIIAHHRQLAAGDAGGSAAVYWNSTQVRLRWLHDVIVDHLRPAVLEDRNTLLSLRGDAASMGALCSVHPAVLVAHVHVLHMHTRLTAADIVFDSLIPYLQRIGFELQRQHWQHAVFLRRDDWQEVVKQFISGLERDGVDVTPLSKSACFGFDALPHLQATLSGQEAILFQPPKTMGNRDMAAEYDENVIFEFGSHCTAPLVNGTYACSITNDPSRVSDPPPTVTTHARHFMKALSDTHPRDWPKPPGQLWAYYSRESPPNDQLNTVAEYVKPFDLKYTVSRASDMWSGTSTAAAGPWQLQYFREQIAEAHEKHADTIAKLRLEFASDPKALDAKIMDTVLPVPVGERYAEEPVLWVASNCGTASPGSTVHNGRFEIAQELSKYVKVAFHGPCLSSGEDQVWPKGTPTFYEELPKYKFYLGFDNSQCFDHVSEKSWRAMLLGVVPIGLAAPNIMDAMPNGEALLNVRAFKSIRALGEEINRLNNDDEAYRRHLRHWAGTESPMHWSFSALSQAERARQTQSPHKCQLCKKALLRRGNAKLMRDNWCTTRSVAVEQSMRQINNG